MTRTYWTGGTLFEELGFYYVGPIDGHDLNVLLPVLQNVRDATAGADPGARASPRRARATRRPRPPTTSTTASTASTSSPARRSAPSPTRRATRKVFAQSLIEEARKDDKIVAITAAMPAGTGLDLFAKEFPDAHLRRRHRRAARR